MLTALGWLVLHSVWQVTLAAGAAALVLGMLRSARPQRRYAVALTALALAFTAPVATAFWNLNAVRLRAPSRTLAVIDEHLDMASLLWWASVLIPIAGGVWLAGIAIGAVRLAVAGARVRALRRQATGRAGATLRTSARRLERRSRGAGADVRTSPFVHVPMVIGWRRPLVIFPEAASARMSPRDVRGLLAHELAHVRRRDYAVNIVQAIVDVLLFHHPAARWLSRRIRIEREYCCDDAAIRAVGQRRDYVRALAALEDGRADTPLAVAASSGTLLDRVQRIAGTHRPFLTPVRGAIVCLAALVVSAVVVALCLLIPPNLPWGAEMRRRMPAPVELRRSGPSVP
jgi:beta-lactamase regulating signal transducer with metallopeptidase domain